MEKISKAQVKMVRSLQQKKFRDELGLFVAEGEKCVEEIRKGFELVHLFREGENATRTEIEQMSGLETPQGVIGVFRKRPNELEMPKEPVTDRLMLMLDGIQNPGNLGTIIRTADWFGIRSIVCSPDTADCYNPKVVQATMGALTRVQLQYIDLPKLLHTIEEAHRLFTPKQPPLCIYGTLLDGKDMYEKGAIDQNRTRGVIIMGNEGKGISPEVRRYITHPIRIPSYPNKEASEVIESLNVAIATAIVLAEFRRN